MSRKEKQSEKRLSVKILSRLSFRLSFQLTMTKCASFVKEAISKVESDINERYLQRNIHEISEEQISTKNLIDEHMS